MNCTRRNIQKSKKSYRNQLGSSNHTGIINNLNQVGISKNQNHNCKNKKTKNISSLKKAKKNVIISYNDYVLNTFDYRNARLYDKRTCFQYYLSLIKVKNAIIFSFCPMKDYNRLIIRSCIFSLSFSIYYATNFAFFNDEIMHEIYEFGGKYDIMLFIPKTAISFAASLRSFFPTCLNTDFKPNFDLVKLGRPPVNIFIAIFTVVFIKKFNFFFLYSDQENSFFLVCD